MTNHDCKKQSENEIIGCVSAKKVIQSYDSRGDFSCNRSNPIFNEIIFHLSYSLHSNYLSLPKVIKNNMQLFNNYSLKNHNTFGIDALCRYFAEVDNLNDIKQILSNKRFTNIPKLILGEGSNVLFTKDYNGLVITQTSNNISITAEDDEFCNITADAGVVWHDLVIYCIDRNLGGIENLALIPGKVGAAPIQNIGAYGQELKDVFHSLKGITLTDLNEIEMSPSDCEFGYRDSIFKRELKNKFIITQVTLRLTKNPVLNIDYWAIKDEIAKLGKENLTIKDVSAIVCMIRRSKLPDPKILGNAGSFFKNPELTIEKFHKLKSVYSDLPGYTLKNHLVKVPAAWLIEHCGLKGKRFGNAGIYEKQALVIVNYGGATAEQIIALKELIQKSVREKFDIELEEEVNLV